jgi:hypothetical protein
MILLMSARSALPGISSNTALLPHAMSNPTTLVRDDQIFVRNYSANWDGIALVMVRHQRNLVGCLAARLDLAQCPFLWRTHTGMLSISCIRSRGCVRSS